MKAEFFEDYQKLISSINNMTKEKEGYGYKYVELTPLLEEVLPKIHENHFVLVQCVSQAGGDYVRVTTEPAVYESKQNKQRIVEGEIKKEIRTPAFVLHSELVHVSGEAIKCDMPLYVDDIDPQAFGSAETYMRRYSIYALLHIKTEDDDGASGSARAKSKQPKTFEDFVKAIYSATSEKQLGAYWYMYREIFAKDSEEYKNLNKFSGNIKLKIINPELTVDIFDGVSQVIKDMVEEK